MHNINISDKKLEKINLIGISVKTSNKFEIENYPNGKIISLLNKFFNEKYSDTIKNQINKDKLFCVYTNYDNNKRDGEYTYFVGKEVSSIEKEFINIDKFEYLTIEKSEYKKFSNIDPIDINQVFSIWQEIWTSEDKNILERSYKSDIEIYNINGFSQNTSSIFVDIYISI
jgi:predicted transcriptional regulator YdeE